MFINKTTVVHIECVDIKIFISFDKESIIEIGLCSKITLKEIKCVQRNGKRKKTKNIKENEGS